MPRQVQIRRRRKIVAPDQPTKPRSSNVPTLDQVRQGRVDYVPGETAEEIMMRQPGGPEIIAAYKQHAESSKAKRERFAMSIMGLQSHAHTVLFEEFEPDEGLDVSELFE